MEGKFEIRSGSIAVGDPVMGMAVYSVDYPEEEYALDMGALVPASGQKKGLIDLDGPYIFVVDATFQKLLEEWFHEVGESCSYVIPLIVDKIPDFEQEHNIRVGFYWEHELSGANKEGQYLLDVSKIKKST